EPLTIGRQVDERGLLIRDPRVSRRHATLRRTKSGGLRLEDTSTNGTFVNGVRVREVVDLEDGDLLRVGDSFLVVRWAPASMSDADVPSLLGRHPAMRELRRTIALVAPTDAKV